MGVVAACMSGQNMCCILGGNKPPSHSCPTPQIQRAVTMAGTNSRVTATGTLPIGVPGRMQRETAGAGLAT